MNAKTKKPVTLYDAFLNGEAQPSSHGMHKGLDEVCRESSRRNEGFRQFVNARRRNGEKEILTHSQAEVYYPEEIAEYLYQVANAFHTEGKVRVKGSPNIYHQKDVADLVALFGGDTKSVITALFHDNIEDLSADVFEMDEYIINGNINGHFPIPTNILPRVINLTNMTSPLSKEIAKQTHDLKAYSLSGILDIWASIDEQLRSHEMIIRSYVIKESINRFWEEAGTELPKREKAINEEHRAKYVLEQLQGTFFNFSEHAKYLSTNTKADIGVKAADRTESAGNDRFLTKDKSFKRIRSGGKSIIITDMIDKTPHMHDEEYFGVQVMKYAILERTFERFRRRNYATPRSRIELQNLPPDEAAEKVWFYENMVEDILKRTDERFQEIITFKESEQLKQYLQSTYYPR